MKRPTSSGSLLCPSSPQGEEKEIYSMVFPSILDGMDDNDYIDEDLSSPGHQPAAEPKKRRLSTDQVRALEKNFEVENKLDPERKLRLAQDLALQPRQVAVWFQNRRARWKTKQLERGYATLKTSYDNLRLDVDALKHDNQTLIAELKELKFKLKEAEEPPPLIYGQSDSGSSTVFNCNITKCCTAPLVESRDVKRGGGDGFSFQQDMLKTEEGEDFEEPCTSLFAEEQAPTLPWWNWMDGGADSNIGSREGAL